MDKGLSDVLAAVAPPQGKKPSLDYHSADCKDAIADLRKHVDNGWLFINYRRRNDKKHGHPVGVAVAFFIKGQLYAGASACRLPPATPSKRVRAEAVKLLCKVAVEYDIPLQAMLNTVQHLSRRSKGVDTWSRHIGIWKAVSAARPLPTGLAAAVAHLSDNTFEDMCHNKSVRNFKLPNLMLRIAHHPDLPPAFASWLHARDGNSRKVPHRVTGAIISSCNSAVHVQAKHDVIVMAAANQAVTPVTAGS